jgi:hypoxanthine phosphoribosyltransferase
VQEGAQDANAFDRDTERIQEPLPPLRWQLQPNEVRFAHPAEAEFARLLTSYGLRWAYEPTTFAVRWGSDGQPAAFVTPDFYLPDHELYVELTTMRQRLVTRKNRKFRLLRQTYPNLHVRMLYLRDYERLHETYRLASSERDGEIGSTLFTEGDIAAQVAELGRQLADTWRGRCRSDRQTAPLLLGVGAGSERFLAALGAHCLDRGLAIETDRIDLTSIAGERRDVKIRVSRPPAIAVAGRLVVLVQEVLSTGLSAAFLGVWLRRHGAASVDVCALLDRHAARIVDVPVICRGFDAPDVGLAGFGLSRWRQYRDLPFIAEVEPS